MELCYEGALVMPSSYMVMDEDEMCYMEGGKFIGVNLSAQQCADIATTLSVLGISFTITSLASGLIGLIPGLQAALAGAKVTGALATVCTISCVVFDYYSRRNGMYIGYDTTKRRMLYGAR